VLSWKSCHGILALPVPVLSVLFWLSQLFCPLLAVLL
jgi:hypothetical protein